MFSAFDRYINTFLSLLPPHFFPLLAPLVSVQICEHAGQETVNIWAMMSACAPVAGEQIKDQASGSVYTQKHTWAISK